MRLTAILEKRRLWNWLWLAAVIAVGVGSLLPDRELQAATSFMPEVNDKLEHFGAYTVLGALSVLKSLDVKRGKRLGLGMILFGIGLEFAQMLSPGRTADVADALADTLGVFGGIALAARVKAVAKNEKS